MKFVSIVSSFAFVVVLMMDRYKSECVISGLNYHFHSLYCLFVWVSGCLSLNWKYVVNNMEKKD